MHFHYFTLQHLQHFLNRTYRGLYLRECYSQNRNELILQIGDKFLRVGCHTPLTYLVPVDTFSKARKNVVDLFPEIIGKKLLSAHVVPYERVMVLKLENDYALILKMHGISANVLLRRGEEIIALFNQQLGDDFNYRETAGPFDAKAIAQSAVPPDKTEILTALRRISPVYEKKFAARIETIMQEGKDFPAAFRQVQQEVDSDMFYLGREPTRIRFYLFPPPQEVPAIEVQRVEAALPLYLRLHFQFSYYQQQYRALEKQLKKPYIKYEKILKGYQASIQQLETERNPEELGHILMANLHQIGPGSKSVELEDFYQGGKLRIKLQPELSPQENAARYYDKSKTRKAKAHHLRLQIGEVAKKLADARAAWEAFAALSPPDQLGLTPRGLDSEALDALRQLSRSHQQQQEEKGGQQLPFRSFEKQGYTILVGRNARNNDELSFKYAHKEDLWLHAKDVTGSHVIIRQKAGQPIPRDVLEYAAQLAAYYSKRKTDSLVPVQYTTRKYIRKRKGDPPGAVAVMREEVIMVEPLRP